METAKVNNHSRRDNPPLPLPFTNGAIALSCHPFGPQSLRPKQKKRSRIMGERSLSRMLACAAVGWALSTAMPANAQTKLNIVTFAGATNLPVWVAIDKGFFAKEGLEVTQEITRGSTPAMQGLMDGKYQFASSALDNTIAITEGEGDVKFDNF